MGFVWQAPSNTGLGFRVAVHKLATVVQLLTGETPERAWFSDAAMGAALVVGFLKVGSKEAHRLSLPTSPTSIWSALCARAGTCALISGKN